MGIIRFFTGGQYSLVNKISLFLLFVSMATAITTTVMAGKKDEHKYKYKCKHRIHLFKWSSCCWRIRNFKFKIC